MLKLGGLVGIPAALVIYQPDLGTGLTYLPILAVGILIAGVQWRYLAIVALVGALTLPVGWYLLKDYQRQRLVTFLDPSGDPRGAGYQVIQSKIAVGDGGVILTSSDGQSFTPYPSGTQAALYDVAAGAGHVVAVGAGGTIVTLP